MGDTASTDHGGPGRRLECRDVDSGVPAGRRAAALAAGDAGQGRLPIADLPIINPSIAREYTETATSGALRSSPGCRPSTRG